MYIDSQILVFVNKLLLLAGDVELNPGPNSATNLTSCLSVVHQNIRSILNKFEYIKDNMLDYDILFRNAS